MIRNKNIVYNPTEIMVPVKLNFSELILKKLLEHKDRVCWINGETEKQQTYATIAQQSMNIAISLTQMGVRAGQIVAIMSENREEFFPAAIGVICAGAVLTAINVGYTSGELKHVLSISKPVYFFCSPSCYKNHNKTLRALPFIERIIVFGEDKFDNTIPFDALAFAESNRYGDEIFDRRNIKLLRNIRNEEFEVADVSGNDTLLVLYSSGTTGLPKGVMLTHWNVITSCMGPVTYDPKHLALNITPWYHVMGLVGNFGAMFVGRTGIYLSKFDINLYLKLIEKYKVFQLAVVPPILVALCKTDLKYDVSSVQMIYCGAAPLHTDTIFEVRKKFPQAIVLQGYGMTEMTLAVIRELPDQPNKQGGVGRVLPGCSVKVADLQTGEALGPNQAGEICMKGPLVMKGYIGIDDTTWRDNEGFCRSGDIGYYDEDGCFFIVDRLKELIKYKAYQVPPAEIEAVLLSHPAVRDAGVVGKEDKGAGEVPVAFVALQPGSRVSEAEIKAFVAQRLSNPKHLRGGVKFVDQIPKTPSGKILRKDLKKLLTSERSKL